MIRRLSGGILSLAMILALVGCDEMALQTTEPTDEPDAKPTEYVGTYRATAETTTVSLDVAADTFVAVALIQPSAGTALRVASVHVKSSEDDGDGRSWLELGGDVNVTGSTATLTITGVSRDGVELEGAELQQYTDCEVTATAGIAFAEEAMQGTVACLSAADNAIVADDVTVVRQDPKALIKGKWRHTTTAGVVVDTFDVQSTQMRITLFPQWYGSVSLSLVLIVDYQITATQIPLMQVSDAVVSAPGVTVAEIVQEYNGRLAGQTPFYYVVDERSLVFSWGQDGYERFERVTE